MSKALRLLDSTWRARLVRAFTVALTATLVLPAASSAQVNGDVWRSFSEQIAVGTELKIELGNGQHFRATLVGTRDDAVLLQPKTRVTVPVQAVPYAAIARMERRQHGGMSAGKAVAIGVASGAGAFLAILAILFATVDD